MPLAVIAELDEEDNHALLNVLVRSLPDLAVTTTSIRLTPSQPLAARRFAPTSTFAISVPSRPTWSR